MPASSPAADSAVSARLTFLRLDPIIRTLLASIQQQQQQQQHESEDEERFLASLRVRSKLIQRLRTTIVEIGGESDGDRGGHGNGAEAESTDENDDGLDAMAEYVLLPLMLTLQGGLSSPPTGPSTPATAPATSNGSGSRAALIRRTAQFRCVEEAALTVASYVGIVDGRARRRRNRRERRQQQRQRAVEVKEEGDGSIGDAVALRCLASTAMAVAGLDAILLNLADDDDDGGGGDNDESGRGDVGASNGNDDAALDTGDECRSALLTCASALFGLARGFDPSLFTSRPTPTLTPTPTPTPTPLAKSIAAYMDGALAARLVGSCLSVLHDLSGAPTTVRQRPGTTASKRSPPPQDRGSKRVNLPGSKRRKGNASLGLTALDALSTMMEAAPVAELWRKVLPGMFAGLFKLTLTSVRTVSGAGTGAAGMGSSSSSSSSSSPKLAASSLRTTARLLSVSLSLTTEDGIDAQDTDGSVGRSEAMAAAELLLSAASSAGAKTVTNTRTGKDGVFSPPTSSSPTSIGADTNANVDATREAFLHEVNVRLPGPLMVLLGLVPVHRSPSVRLAGVDLCRAVLVDTRSAWSFKTGEEARTDKLHHKDNCGGGEGSSGSSDDDKADGGLCRAAMECCLSLLKDTNESIFSDSRKVLDSYRVSFDEASWRDLVSDDVVPRLMDLMEGLPILAQSGRGSELRSQMKLVSGYLLLANGVGKAKGRRDGKENKRTTNRSDIGAALACEGVSSAIRSSLADVFRLDYSSVGLAPQLPSKDIIEQSLATSFQQASSNRFLYLRDDSISAAIQMVQSLALALGRKRGALFVDSCIAEIYDASDGIRHDRNGQLGWLDKWAGLLVVANEVLSASFGPKDKDLTSMVHIGGDITDDVLKRNNKAENRKTGKSKILRSLASSILPVLVRGPLWDLPSSLEAAEYDDCNRDDAGEEAVQTYIASSRYRYKSTEERRRPDIVLNSEASVSVFAGNAIFLGNLMGLIGTISELLGANIRPFLPTILFPLLEKTSACHHHHLQRAAVTALERVARASGSRTIMELLSENFDYLVEALTARLCLASGASRSRHIQTEHGMYYYGVMEILLRSLTAKECLVENGASERTSSDLQLLLLAELMDKILIMYDTSSTGVGVKSNRYSRNSATLGLLKAFGAAVHFIDLTTRKSLDGSTTSESEVVDDNSEPWLDHLVESEQHRRLEQFNEDQHESRLTPEEGFSRQHEGNESANKIAGNGGNGDSLGMQHITTAIATVNSMLSRCCFFLTFPDLKVQVACCEVIVSAFQFLAFAEGALKTCSESPESVGNPSLVAINNCWPSINSRLRTTSDILLRNKQCLLIASKESSEGSQLEHEVFLSKLLDCVASFSEISGDFMIGRFEKDAWPVIAQLIGHSLFVRKQKRLGQEESRRSPADSKSITQQAGGLRRKEVALLSLLDCLSRTFRSRQTGQGLSSLVAAAGTLILPLLDDDGEVGDSTMTTFKTLLSIDCDGLWRALLVASGERVPTRLFRSVRGGEIGPAVSADVVAQSMMMKRASKLIAYANGLPEQVLA